MKQQWNGVPEDQTMVWVLFGWVYFGSIFAAVVLGLVISHSLVCSAGLLDVGMLKPVCFILNLS
jgi:hypothetical protein